MRTRLSPFFPKNHPVDSKMRPIIARSIWISRWTMPLEKFALSARKRNEEVVEVSGDAIQNIMEGTNSFIKTRQIVFAVFDKHKNVR